MKRFWIVAGVWSALYLVGQLVSTPEVSPETVRVGGYQQSPGTGFKLPVMGLALYLIGLLVIYIISGLNMVKEWNRRPYLLFGKYAGDKAGGLTWIEPIFHTVMNDVYIGATTQELEVPNVLTHDNVPITFNLVLTSQVAASMVRDFTVKVRNGRGATEERALATITEAVGNTELDQILHNRTDLNTTIVENLRQKVLEWGVAIIALEIKNIKITDAAIEQAIAMKARASKEADAEFVRAQMQGRIATGLSDAAKAMTPDGWRLKQMEVMLELCRSGQNNTILIPTEIIAGIRSLISS